MESPTKEQVRALREAARFTQAEFGAVVYASVRAVQAWEYGLRPCPPTAWELLQIYFGQAEPRRFRITIK
jgi:DNA-binding transcriptional regulator YiaG